MLSTLAPDHPSDEDLSPGTPVGRKDGARNVVASWVR
jgi:hypothetical protein